jgi:hypothetical protein
MYARVCARKKAEGADMGITFDVRARHVLRIVIDGASVWAFADFDTGQVLVPVIGGADREAVTHAVQTWWPWVAAHNIVWPEKLDVQTVNVSR